MKPRIALASALTALALTAGARAQAPPFKELERVQSATDVLIESSKIPEKGVPAALLRACATSGGRRRGAPAPPTPGTRASSRPAAPS